MSSKRSSRLRAGQRSAGAQPAYKRTAVRAQLRGAEMLFAALLAVTCLHRTLNRLHYTGIACCLVR